MSGSKGFLLPDFSYLMHIHMADHNNLGKWGEQKAAEYLQQKGYIILERDWKWQRRDLDIVALKSGVLVIVEVKTRKDDRFTLPERSVDYKKMRSISIAANSYIKLRGHYGKVRFDVISIIGTDDENCHIEHIEDAFLPPTMYRW